MFFGRDNRPIQLVIICCLTHCLFISLPVLASHSRLRHLNHTRQNRFGRPVKGAHLEERLQHLEALKWMAEGELKEVRSGKESVGVDGNGGDGTKPELSVDSVRTGISKSAIFTKYQSAAVPEPLTEPLFNYTQVPFYLIPPSTVPAYTSCDTTQFAGIKSNQGLDAIQHMVEHEWRTELEEAEIIVVPALIDHMMEKKCPGQTFASFTTSIIKTVRSLGKCTGAGSKVHLIIATAYNADTVLVPVMQSLPCVRGAIFEPTSHTYHFTNVYAKKVPGNCVYPIGYPTMYNLLKPGHYANEEGVMRPPPNTPRHAEYFASFVGVCYKDTPYFKYRCAMCESKGEFVGKVYITCSGTKQRGLPKIEECRHETVRDRCIGRVNHTLNAEIRERTVFELCLPGGTPGSDRWINAIAAGSIPVAIDDGHSLLEWFPFKRQIPWNKIVVFLDAGKFMADPVKTINALSEMDPEDVRRRQILLNKHLADVDWEVRDSRVLRNVLSDARDCATLPRTVHKRLF